MSSSSVWVELGRGSLVRADSITKVEAADDSALSVKVTGEREPRLLVLSPPARYPDYWTGEDVDRFEAMLDPATLARGLIDAIADAAAERGGCEVALRAEPNYRQVGWRRRDTGEHGRFEIPGESFWDFAFDDLSEQDDGFDYSTVQAAEIYGPQSAH